MRLSSAPKSHANST
jgi:hypothetical protein